jgi:hypothetical protein
MERMQTREIGRRTDGTLIVRNFFINDDKTNYLTKAQSYFTKSEKKEAKLNYKLNKNK